MKDSNVECGSIILNKEMNKVIIVYQRLSNKWGLPKGHMSKEEIEYKDKLSCAIRETKEETGLTLKENINCKIIGKFNMNNKNFFIFHLFDDKINLHPIDTKEISYVKWINLIDIKNFIDYNDSNRSLRELNKKQNILSNKIFKEQNKLIY